MTLLMEEVGTFSSAAFSNKTCPVSASRIMACRAVVVMEAAKPHAGNPRIKTGAKVKKNNKNWPHDIPFAGLEKDAPMKPQGGLNVNDALTKLLN